MAALETPPNDVTSLGHSCVVATPLSRGSIVGMTIVPVTLRLDGMAYLE